jgi:hypothetical protein
LPGRYFIDAAFMLQTIAGDPGFFNSGFLYATEIERFSPISRFHAIGKRWSGFVEARTATGGSQAEPMGS